MSILGIGVDVVHIPRTIALTRHCGAQQFVSRILGRRELSDWNSLPPHTTEFARARFLAVRWSVKEAAYKAVFPTGRPSWKELTYCNDGTSPKPLLLYKSRMPQHTSVLGRTHVSVSHYVFASVVVEAS